MLMHSMQFFVLLLFSVEMLLDSVRSNLFEAWCPTPHERKQAVLPTQEEKKKILSFYDEGHSFKMLEKKKKKKKKEEEMCPKE